MVMLMVLERGAASSEQEQAAQRLAYLFDGDVDHALTAILEADTWLDTAEVELSDTEVLIESIARATGADIDLLRVADRMLNRTR